MLCGRSPWTKNSLTMTWKYFQLLYSFQYCIIYVRHVCALDFIVQNLNSNHVHPGPYSKSIQVGSGFPIISDQHFGWICYTKMTISSLWNVIFWKLLLSKGQWTKNVCYYWYLTKFMLFMFIVIQDLIQNISWLRAMFDTKLLHILSKFISLQWLLLPLKPKWYWENEATFYKS